MKNTDGKVLDFNQFKKAKEEKLKNNQPSQIGMTQEEFEKTFMKKSIKSLFGEKGMSFLINKRIKMKKLLIIILFVCNTAFASLVNANNELSSQLKNNVSLEFLPQERGPSSFIHGSSIGTCKKVNDKYIIKINKIWWLDVDNDDKIGQILTLCNN